MHNQASSVRSPHLVLCQQHSGHSERPQGGLSGCCKARLLQLLTLVLSMQQDPQLQESTASDPLTLKVSRRSDSVKKGHTA